MIGEAATKTARPQIIPKVPVYAKGALLQMVVAVKATGQSYIFDDFDTLDDWIMVHGQLLLSGGDTSDVYGPVIGYAAGRHKTQLLTDNHRAKVVIQDGVMAYGESRVAICADELFAGYYGMAIRNGLSGGHVEIIRGKSSISVDAYETTAVSLSAGDEFEVWYDRENSTVRVYQNSSEVCSKYFAPTDIPHGPGCRWTGVVMSARWLLDQGPRFDSFEATDVAYPAPVIHDPVDSLTVNPKWTNVTNSIKVNRNVLYPPSLGPDKVLFNDAAAYWSDAMGTNSVRLVVTVLRVISGKLRIAVRSNTAMTNWVGFEFNTTNNTIKAVKGTGPTTVSTYGSAKAWVKVLSQWTVTWDEGTKTLSLFSGNKQSPVLQWQTGGAFTPSGKYVGLSWHSDFLTDGVEVTALDAYDVTADSPLPAAAIVGGS